MQKNKHKTNSKYSCKQQEINFPMNLSIIQTVKMYAVVDHDPDDEKRGETCHKSFFE